MKIDIERLIDAVTAENEAYNEYCHSSKTLYRGPFEEITARKNHVNYAREVHDREQNAIDTLTEVSRWTQRHATGFILQLEP